MELMEKTVESRVLFEGKIITVRLDKAELPNGRVASREVVEHPGGVAILPLFDDGTVSLVRQFRYPFQEVVAELPAGKLERGEDHRLAALRELEEENGVQYVAARKEEDQVSLTAIGEGEVLDALRRCQPDTLTPIEAMSLIYEWKQKLN